MTQAVALDVSDDPRGDRDDYMSLRALDATLELLVRGESQSAGVQFRRVIEDIDVNSRVVRRKVSLEVSLEEKVRHVLVPILIRRRGVLIDGLKIEDNPGVASFTLDGDETRDVASGILRLYARRALASSGLSLPDKRQLEEDAGGLPLDSHLAWSRVLMNCLRLEERDKDMRTPATMSGYEHGLALLARDANFMKLARLLFHERLVLVPVWRDHRYVKVDFSYEVSQDELVMAGSAPWYREATGHAPFDFLVDLQYFTRSAPYHCRVRVAERAFVAQFEAVDRPPSGSIRRQTVLTPVSTRSYVQQGNGPTTGSLAHVYLRSLAPDANAPMLRLTFNDRPLGCNGAALARIILVFCIIGTVQLLGARLVTTNALPVALLVALPGLLSVAPRSPVQPSDRMEPMSARVATVVAGSSAVAAALVFLAWAAIGSEAADGVPFPAPWPVSVALYAILATVGVSGVVCALRLKVAVKLFRLAHRRDRNERLERA